MKMRIGAPIYSTWQGLGVLARSFYDSGILTDVLIVNHKHRPNNYGWYPKVEYPPVKYDNPGLLQAFKFCSDCDVVIFFETPFWWELIPYCKSKGIKTVLMPMMECMPSVLPEVPDLIMCPSMLDMDYYSPDPIRNFTPFEISEKSKSYGGAKVTFTPIPVQDSFVWKERKRALKFVHNAGHGGLLNRNGTGELLDALPLIKSPIQLLIRSQEPLKWDIKSRDPRLRVAIGTINYDDLYKEGDVFTFVEKFNGLCLPLQEAYASGMLVIAGNRFPINTWLPTEPLVPVASYRISRISGRCNEFNEAIITPQAIAETIDTWFNKDVSELSQRGRIWKEDNSWKVLGPKYKELLQSL